MSDRWRRCVTTQAEVERRSRHRIDGSSLGSQLHGSPSGTRQPHRNVDRRHRHVVDRVAERPSAHPDMGDVSQPRRRAANHAERIDDVLTVGPRLHQPSGDERARCHRRAVPRHSSCSGRALTQRRASRCRSSRQRVNNSAGSIDRPGSTDASVPPLAISHSVSAAKRIGIGQRQQRSLIEEPQMADLIANRPPG